MKKRVEEQKESLRDHRREGVHHVGNATHWVVLRGVSFLTDPWLSEPADRTISHRVKPAPFPRDPDVVLVTHRHEDHFDTEALALIAKSAVVVIPPKLVDEVRALGFADVRAAKPGDRLEVAGCEVRVVLGKHDVHVVCYRVEREGRAFFFGADSMLTPEIEELAREKPTELVILPGERSSLMGKAFVMTPEDAIGLAERFRAKRAVLSHHESYVSHPLPYGLMVKIPEPDPREFPEWFSVPAPYDYIPFPEVKP